MSFIGVEIQGIEGLHHDLRRYGKEGEKAIGKAVDDTAKAIETIAKNRLKGFLTNVGEFITSKSGRKTAATRGHGGAGLSGSIYNRKVANMERAVGSDKHYAPYIEFGTGEKVFTNFEFDEDARRVAAQFKGRKRVKGIRGTSFLNYAAVQEQEKLVKRIETNLNAINR